MQKHKHTHTETHMQAPSSDACMCVCVMWWTKPTHATHTHTHTGPNCKSTCKTNLFLEVRILWHAGSIHVCTCIIIRVYVCVFVNINVCSHAVHPLWKIMIHPLTVPQANICYCLDTTNYNYEKLVFLVLWVQCLWYDSVNGPSLFVWGWVLLRMLVCDESSRHLLHIDID